MSLTSLLWNTFKIASHFKSSMVLQLLSTSLSLLIRSSMWCRTLRSSDEILLFKFTFSSFNLETHGGCSLISAASSVWNTLPLELRPCKSLSSFKEIAF